MAQTRPAHPAYAVHIPRQSEIIAIGENASNFFNTNDFGYTSPWRNAQRVSP